MCEELLSCCQAHLWHTHTQQVLLIKLQTERLASGSPGWIPASPAPRLSLNLVIFFILLLLSFQPAGSYVMLVMKMWSSSGTSLRPSLHLFIAESRSSCITCGDSFIGTESIFGSCEDRILKLLQAVNDTEGGRFLFTPGLWRWARDMDLLCAVWQDYRHTSDLHNQRQDDLLGEFRTAESLCL